MKLFVTLIWLAITAFCVYMLYKVGSMAVDVVGVLVERGFQSSMEWWVSFIGAVVGLLLFGTIFGTILFRMIKGLVDDVKEGKK